MDGIGKSGHRLRGHGLSSAGFIELPAHVSLRHLPGQCSVRRNARLSIRVGDARMPNIRSAISTVVNYFTGRLGRCPKCTHSSFVAAVSAVSATLLLWLFAAPLTLILLAGSASFILTLLWMSHVWMFTLRSARATALRSVPGTGGAGAPWSRRRLLAAFLRILVFSAVAAGLPRGLRAQSCNCYSEQNCYCPPDFPQCIFNPSTGEAICCGPGTTGCAGPNSTWCCPPGSNCYGTDNQCY